MAYVAAMIAGCEVEEVFQFCGHDGSAIDNDERNRHPEKRRGFMDNEISAFLASRGIARNAVGALCDGQPKWETEGGNRGILCRIPDYLAAELTVYSDRLPGCTHAVYWDGKVVRDPNPDRPDEGKIEDYRVKAWYPVVNLNEGVNNQVHDCPSCAALRNDARSMIAACEAADALATHHLGDWRKATFREEYEHPIVALCAALRELEDHGNNKTPIS